MSTKSKLQLLHSCDFTGVTDSIFIKSSNMKYSARTSVKHLIKFYIEKLACNFIYLFIYFEKLLFYKLLYKKIKGMKININ